MAEFLGYLGIGAFVGFFAGMLGIGGGAITVPLVALMLAAKGMPREHVVHLAVGTSMAVIAVTSVASGYAHSRRGAVRWDLVRTLVPGILAGGLGGALLAGRLSTLGLAVFFACFVYFNAANILFEFIRPKPALRTPGPAGMFAAGLAISGLSALVAVGGAVLSIPFLVYCNVPMIQAIGTAAAIGFPIAIAGSIGYVATGLMEGGLPPWSIGYVYLPALAGIGLASVLTAPLGARAAHGLPTKVLKRVFAVLLLILATQMLWKLV